MWKGSLTIEGGGMLPQSIQHLTSVSLLELENIGVEELPMSMPIKLLCIDAFMSLIG